MVLSKEFFGSAKPAMFSIYHRLAKKWDTVKKIYINGNYGINITGLPGSRRIDGITTFLLAGMFDFRQNFKFINRTHF